MPYYTAIVTMLAVAFYFFLATRVATAHIKFDVRLPATTGNSDFERIYRVHINTLVWIAGRIAYFAGYRRAVEKRLPGFFIQATACLLLFIGAAAGLVMRYPYG